jgi:hypothetical protein
MTLVCLALTWLKSVSSGTNELSGQRGLHHTHVHCDRHTTVAIASHERQLRMG